MERLRFKDENGNDFPEWTKTKLSRLSTIKTGKLDANAMKKRGNYKFFTCSRKNYFTDTYSFQGESLIIAGNGEIGNVKYYNGKFDAYQRTYVIQGFSEKMNSMYLKNYLIQNLPKQVHRETNKGAMPYIRLATLSEMLVLSPVREEQEKIGGFLSAFDRLIEKQRDKVELLKTSKKGYIQHLFERSLRFKDESGKWYPEWRETILKNICRFSKGKNISKDDVSEQGLECIRYGQLYTDYSENIEEIISKTDKHIDSLVIGEINDLLVPASGETREDIASVACLQKSKVAIGGDINILKSKENSLFLAYYLNNAARNQLSSMAQGASILHLYKQQLEKVKIELPVIEEQSKIAQFLKWYDDLIKINVALLDKYEKLKQSYLQRLFYNE